jgi:ADP-ribosylglycohydrolase
MIPAADRFSGFIVGQCLGDALGFLVEGEAPQVCLRYADEVVRPGKLPHVSRDGFSFGQYSDESQMARELMESYVVCSGFDGDDYARRIAALFSEDRVVGRGRTTEEAALRLVAGVPWREAGTPPPAAGNASAMRAGVLGLIYGDDPNTMIRIAHEQGLITHADLRCSAGAVAMAGAVALASRGARPNLPEFLEPLRLWTMRIEPSLSSSLRQMEELLAGTWEHAAEEISRIGLPPGVDSQWRGGISAFVVSSVLWALYAYMKHPDSYAEAVALAIRAGGDVDTTAAMTGALIGARLGLSAVPHDLAGKINDHGGWGYDDLIALAQACHDLHKNG